MDELFKNLRGGEELEGTEPHAPIFRVTYYLSDHVLLIQPLKSEPYYCSPGPDPAGTRTLTALFADYANMDTDPAEEKKYSPTGEERPQALGPLCVYLYHGNARRLDTTFLADFDVVITTYSTLATEYPEQTCSLEEGDELEVASDSGNDANESPQRPQKSGNVRGQLPMERRPPVLFKVYIGSE